MPEAHSFRAVIQQMDYVIRGALLTPAAGSGKANLHFLVDTIDADMFLRADRC
jgi:hypothetical protein